MSCNIHYIELLKSCTCSYQNEKEFKPHCKTEACFEDKNTMFLQCRFIKHFIGQALKLLVFLLSERVMQLKLLTKKELKDLGDLVPLFSGMWL